MASGLLLSSSVPSGGCCLNTEPHVLPYSREMSVSAWHLQGMHGPLPADLPPSIWLPSQLDALGQMLVEWMHTRPVPSGHFRFSLNSRVSREDAELLRVCSVGLACTPEGQPSGCWPWTAAGRCVLGPAGRELLGRDAVGDRKGLVSVSVGRAVLTNSHSPRGISNRDLFPPSSGAGSLRSRCL